MRFFEPCDLGIQAPIRPLHREALTDGAAGLQRQAAILQRDIRQSGAGAFGIHVGVVIQNRTARFNHQIAVGDIHGAIAAAIKQHVAAAGDQGVLHASVRTCRREVVHQQGGATGHRERPRFAGAIGDGHIQGIDLIAHAGQRNDRIGGHIQR